MGRRGWSPSRSPSAMRRARGARSRGTTTTARRCRLGRDGFRMVQAVPRIREADPAAPGGPASPATGDDQRAEVFDDANVGRPRRRPIATHWWFRSQGRPRRHGSAPARQQGRGADGWLVDVGGGRRWASPRCSAGAPDRVVDRRGQRRVLCGAGAPASTASTAVQATVDRVPVAAEAADVVCLLDVIEHLADPVAGPRRGARGLSAAAVGSLSTSPPTHGSGVAADVALGPPSALQPNASLRDRSRRRRASSPSCSRRTSSAGWCRRCGGSTPAARSRRQPTSDSTVASVLVDRRRHGPDGDRATRYRSRQSSVRDVADVRREAPESMTTADKRIVTAVGSRRACSWGSPFGSGPARRCGLTRHWA